VQARPAREVVEGNLRYGDEATGSPDLLSLNFYDDDGGRATIEFAAEEWAAFKAYGDAILNTQPK